MSIYTTRAMILQARARTPKRQYSFAFKKTRSFVWEHFEINKWSAHVICFSTFRVIRFGFSFDFASVNEFRVHMLSVTLRDRYDVILFDDNDIVHSVFGVVANSFSTPFRL